MRSPIDRLKSGEKNKELTENDIDFIHDILMVEYGWIPIEEFRKIPLPTLWCLLNRIKERKDKEQREYEKSRRK